MRKSFSHHAPRWRLVFSCSQAQCVETNDRRNGVWGPRRVPAEVEGGVGRGALGLKLWAISWRAPGLWGLLETTCACQPPWDSWVHRCQHRGWTGTTGPL